MDTNEKPCRHEYVKFYQRKYKNYERRLVSTRGYLPTGFSNKDFSFLTAGAYCFCTKCRTRLFPTRHESTKNSNTILTASVADPPTVETMDNVWIEETAGASPTTSQEIEVEELQIEATDVSDIVDKEIVVNQQDITDQESEGE